MKRVTAEELAAHPDEYLTGAEPLSIEKDGQVLGYYTPVPNGHTSNGHAASGPDSGHLDAPHERRRRKAAARAASERLSALLQKVYAETGMTEEELASYFDLSKPIPPASRPES